MATSNKEFNDWKKLKVTRELTKELVRMKREMEKDILQGCWETNAEGYALYREKIGRYKALIEILNLQDTYL